MALLARRRESKRLIARVLHTPETIELEEDEVPRAAESLGGEIPVRVLWVNTCGELTTVTGGRPPARLRG